MTTISKNDASIGSDPIGHTDLKDEGRRKMVVRLQASLLLLLPVLLVFSHRNIVILASLLMFSGLLLPGSTGLRPYLRAPFARGTVHPAISFLGLFAAYVALAVFWSPRPFDFNILLREAVFCGIIIVLLGQTVVFPKTVAKPIARIFSWAVILSMLLLGFEAMTGGLLRDWVPPVAKAARDNIATARGITIAVMLSFPAALIMLAQFGRSPAWFRFGVLIIAFAALTYASTQFDSSTNAAALGIGLLAASIAFFLPNITISLISIFFILALVTAPFLAALLPPQEVLAQINSGPASWVQRLIIWQYTGTEIFASPTAVLFGGGADVAQTLHENTELVLVNQVDVPLEVFPTHPHNVFLHVWLEFGAVGAGLLTAAFVGLGNYLSKFTFPPSLAAAVAGLAAATFVVAYVDMSLWTFWRLTAPLLAVYGLITFQRSVS